MKRSSRTPSEEERALFREVLKGVRSLRAAKKLAITKPPKPKPAPVTKTPAPAVIKEEPVAKFGGHLEMRTRRGRAEPEAKLDLHGLHESEAYRALERFLMRSQAEKKRLVLVITGKGGVLRANLPRWLAEAPFRAMAVGMNEAHPRHGGAGAFYVALKRKKPKRAR